MSYEDLAKLASKISVDRLESAPDNGYFILKLHQLQQAKLRMEDANRHAEMCRNEFQTTLQRLLDENFDYFYRVFVAPEPLALTNEPKEG